MKRELESLLRQAAEDAGILGPGEAHPPLRLDRPREESHGDYSSNAALVLAKAAKLNPRDLAVRLVAALPPSSLVARVEIAGPGFINFHLTAQTRQAVVTAVLDRAGAYGRSPLGAGRRVQVEFVSANPTGPLHIGHGRGAAYGACIANLLAETGFQVHREYYVNDAGRQMDILAVSVWLRYLELLGTALAFPANAYRGAYVRDIAEQLRLRHGEALGRDANEVFDGLPTADPEQFLDALIARARGLLGDEGYRVVHSAGLDSVLAGIKADLEDFGVSFDEWFSEASLADDGSVDRAIRRLEEQGQLYLRDGALWFRTTDFGDEKDRVVVRENGQTTYFASDIAYHMNKLERGFDQVIDVWGADHHGYVPRVKAALAAVGEDPERLEVLLVQFATLYRGQERVQMSTRSGEFVTLRELCEEVGRDAARYFYVQRKSEQHLDFDLELATSQSADNPVYYIQYAHARICSVLRQLADKGWAWDEENGRDNLHLLVEPHEQALLSGLGRYPELVEAAALAREPHQLAHFLRELANQFHVYYNAHQFLVEEAALRNARLSLILAVRQVLANGLRLLGVSAPESM